MFDNLERILIIQLNILDFAFVHLYSGGVTK